MEGRSNTDKNKEEHCAYYNVRKTVSAIVDFGFNNKVKNQNKRERSKLPTSHNGIKKISLTRNSARNIAEVKNPSKFSIQLKTEISDR